AEGALFGGKRSVVSAVDWFMRLSQFGNDGKSKSRRKSKSKSKSRSRIAG
ncbi:MAG: hypothetical protein ACJAU9_001554, partial [Lentimonas sp.]